MKKLSKLFLLTLILFFFPISLVNAEEGKNFPQGDFRLINGYAKINWDEVEKMYGYTFNDISIEIKEGKVTGSIEKYINFWMPNDQDHEGTVTLKINGDYDKDTGYLYGDAELAHDVKTVKHMTVTDFNGASTDTKTGKFTGYVNGDRAVMSFMLKGFSKNWMERALGEIERHDIPTARNFKVAYQVVKSGNTPKDTAPISEVDKIFLDENGKPVNSETRVSAVTGEVEIHIPGEPEESWHLVKMETVIPAGARIRTGENSTIILSFADQSMATLKSESDVYITTAPKESKLKLIAGDIYLNIKKMVKDNSMAIEMNQAMASIKGTTLECSETNEGSKVKVYEGVVSVKNIKTNEETSVKGGHEILIDVAGKSLISGIQEIDNNIGAEYADVDWDKIDQLNIGNGTPNQEAEKPKGENKTNNLLIIFGVVFIILPVLIWVVLRIRK